MYIPVWLCLKHRMWRADAFEISLSHFKNDPVSSRNWHPRHFYTDPDNYPVLFPQLLKNGNGMFFPVPKQGERFGAILQCKLEKHKDKLLELGYEPNDIGVHSIRKGAGPAYAANSGTKGAPSSA